MSDPEPTADAEEDGSSPTPRLLAAGLFCENCGERTGHRILRLDPRSDAATGQVRGIARCRVCRFTHPFEEVSPPPVQVSTIVSEGATSRPTRMLVPAGARLAVGELVPDSDPPMKIHRIDTTRQERVRGAGARDVSTLWVTPDVGAVLPVSITGGRRTEATRVVLPPETEVAVGEPLRLSGGPLRIVALRARGHTWRRAGDRFTAAEVQRVYVRRTESPPAGRSAWRSDREIPSSRASSTSRSARSRSGPGVRRKRTVPRDRSADGGATVQSVAPR